MCLRSLLSPYPNSFLLWSCPVACSLLTAQAVHASPTACQTRGWHLFPYAFLTLTLLERVSLPQQCRQQLHIKTHLEGEDQFLQSHMQGAVVPDLTSQTRKFSLSFPTPSRAGITQVTFPYQVWILAHGAISVLALPAAWRTWNVSIQERERTRPLPRASHSPTHLQLLHSWHETTGHAGACSRQVTTPAAQGLITWASLISLFTISTPSYSIVWFPFAPWSVCQLVSVLAFFIIAQLLLTYAKRLTCPKRMPFVSVRVIINICWLR